MKALVVFSIIASSLSWAGADTAKYGSYQFKESTLANYVPQFSPQNVAGMTKSVREPVESFGSVLFLTSVEIAKSVGNGLALLSGIVEYQVSNLKKNGDAYSLNIQPFLGGNYNMLIQHTASLETKYVANQENGTKVHHFSFGAAKVSDVRPWNEKLAIYLTPEITAEGVDKFFSNASVFHKFYVKNDNCKDLQNKISDKIPNYGYADYIMDREIKFSEKSSLMFKIKLDKINRVNFAIDPAVKDGMCTAYIQSFATKQEVGGFDFDEKIVKTKALLESFAANQNVDISNIEVVQPPKSVQIGRQ